ncbi:MAG: hypothetical protein FWD42_04860 [Solirubrobacterales bacterium]|nr:hypothetical protein [Solirubrobacterales bacterium]
MRAPIALLAVLLPLALATGCGESAQAKAEKTVCEGKSEISAGVNGLKGMTSATATVSAVQSNLKSIESGLGKVTSAQDQLSSKRREEVEHATAQLSAGLSSFAHELTSLTGAQAQAKLAAAGEKLVASYQHALAPIPC